MTPELAPYEMLELLVTLRCNVTCKNCLRLCNSEDVTGMDYAGLDMTWRQVMHFIAQVEAVAARRLALGRNPMVTPMVVITGGEPTLHPHIIEIARAVQELLVVPGLVGAMCINSNLLRRPPLEIAPWVVNFTPVAEKALAHSAVLLAPTTPPQFDPCRHYRKWRVECSAHGFSLCCSAGGYIRLFGLGHLYSPTLPDRPEEFSFLPRMNDVCQHCAFGGMPVAESLVGRPVDLVYAAAAELNRVAPGSVRIAARLPEAS